ncbi:MAG: hypothetical protein QM579_02885 [Desulfovibrio sp.]|uniref:hypothetical protein n=1 Tax=Desulfovibrio sp. TaxID=885 RepID=UPI0039E63870
MPSETGMDLVTPSFNGIPGKCDRYLLAKSVVEGRSQEELIEYIAKMLLGIEIMKQQAMRGQWPG